MSKVYVGSSDIEGKGLFAKRDIKKGEIAFIAKGKIIRWRVLDEEDSKVGPNWLGIGKDIWLDPEEGSYLDCTNHSCNPNLGIKGRVTFVALRDIKKGEELSFDYSTTEEDRFWKLPYRCKCGSSNCRRSVRSIQYLPEEIFASRSDYIPKYFRNVYLRYNGKSDILN